MKRDIFTASLDLGHELSIDNFAGGGGASTGMADGLGREVDVAINHDGEALAMHAANHPTTAHYTEDVFSVHPGFVTRQLPIGLAWFSPDCKHFSKAKGSKPVDKKIRGLAWVTLKWATFQMPRVIMLENVEEFQDWGPVGDDGKPIKSEKGRTFKAFIAALTTGIQKDHPDLEEIYTVLGHDFPIERLYAGCGYKVEWRVLRACDYGTPTIRKRLFLIARRDGRPIVWPTPTHGDPKSDAVKAGKLLPWRTAAECIDWSIPCPSIFERKRPLKDATLRRIAKGIMKFVVNSADPFIVGAGGPIYSGKPRGIDAPMNTLLQENHSHLITPVIARIGQTGGNGDYVNNVGSPVTTIVSKAEHLLVSPTLMHVTHQGSDRTAAVDQPLATVTGANRGEQALITAHISSYYSDKRPGDVRGGSLEDPLATQPTENRHALVSAHITKFRNNSIGTGMDEPLHTVTAGGECKRPAGAAHAMGVVTAFLAKHYGGVVGTGVDVPAGTVTTSDHHSVVTSNLVKLRGTSTAAGTDEPLGTISAGGQHHAEVRAFLVKYYSEGGQWQDLREPMHTVPTKDRLGLVTIKGEDYAIVDIGMRMLTPRELARAQGFPDSYILDPIVNGKPLSKSAQVRMIGNSVCPPMAAALVKANFTHEQQIVRAA